LNYETKLACVFRAAVLPQHELSAYTYLQRKYELEVRRQLYQWDLSDSLPGRIKADSYDDLPREAQFNFQVMTLERNMETTFLN